MVASVIIKPGDTQVSGGVNAGVELTKAISKTSKTTMLIMFNKNIKKKYTKTLQASLFKCNNLFPKCVKSLLPKYIYNCFYSPKPLLKKIKKIRPDLVHIHNSHPALAMWQVSKFCKKNNFPYVVSAHGINEVCNPKMWVGFNPIKLLFFFLLTVRPFKKSLQNAKGIFLTSKEDYKDLNKLKIKANKVFVVRNGYNKKLFLQNNILKQKNQEKKQSPVKYFFLGNHVANKGIDVLLKACHLLKKKCVVFIGGKIKDKKYHKKFLQKYNYKKIKDFVFFTDYLSLCDLRKMYYSSNAFIFPSKADTLPLVILDAMACSLPVIASNVGGISSLINRRTGRLIPPDNPNALSLAMDELTSSQKLRYKLGRAAKKKCLKYFDWDIAAKLSIRYYKKILHD